MLPVVFSTDHNYVMPTGITIASLLLKKEDEEYDIYVLISSNVTNEDKVMLSRQVEKLAPLSKISFIEMGDKFNNGYEIREISTACYYRLMIPWLIPHIDKIIYCDVDIVFKTSLRNLYNTELGDNLVAGATPNMSDGWKKYKNYFDKIGIDYKEYINSGVLVINSRLQREQHLDKEYNRLSKYKFLYQDQDIINLACKGKICHFNNRYNMMPQLYATKDDLINEVIIHYTGDKPWKSFTYAWDEWWSVYKLTIFFDGKFYHDVSKNILNPVKQGRLLCKKAKQKLIQTYARAKSYNLEK